MVVRVNNADIEEVNGLYYLTHLKDTIIYYWKDGFWRRKLVKYCIYPMRIETGVFLLWRQMDSLLKFVTILTKLEWDTPMGVVMRLSLTLQRNGLHFALFHSMDLCKMNICCRKADQFSSFFYLPLFGRLGLKYNVGGDNM